MTFQRVTGVDGNAIHTGGPYLSATPAEEEMEYYVDRNYVIDRIPDALEGGTLIRGENDDIGFKTETFHIVYEYKRYPGHLQWVTAVPSTGVYVCPLDINTSLHWDSR